MRLTPAGVPAHRVGPPWRSPEERARLVEAAASNHVGLRLWRVELERPGASYSHETVEALATELPGAEIWFIMGADQLAAFSQWRNPESIVDRARIAVAPRPGIDSAEAEAAAGPLAHGRLDWLDMPPLSLSSTNIRERIAAGRSVRYLVPDPVIWALGEMGALMGVPADGYPAGT